MLVAVVMSGDVCCWFGLLGLRVGVFWFRISWSEFSIIWDMSCPLWSLVVECHVVEWAFMSPAIMQLSSRVR